ncbi:MAG TPA: ABC transporter substrate-binding protein, partial [Longimicrobiales bacterium]|nr:ABC transporter substrate-binding protein [Longimicrobiales bacterium]
MYGALVGAALLVTCSTRDRPPEGTISSADGFCEAVEPRVDAFVRRMEQERPPPDDPRYGGTVVFSQGGDIPGGMNVFAGSDYVAFQHQLFVNLMSLIRYDEELMPEPWLARSWELADDTSSITFRLRDDVFWHDGVRTSAYDVAFTYERVTDPETGFPNAAFWENYVPGSAGVEVADSFTVTV